jgi:hypothetical protein
MSTLTLKRPYTIREVPFTTSDNHALNVIQVRGNTPPTRGPVLLVHGAGVRANIFCAPVETTFVDYLIDHGYDVWLENWRASIDFPKNQWNLDQAALFDHPAAVKAVIRETGAPSLKAVIHCQGSTSFAMSAVAGLIPEVTTIVTNAVSLHPVVPPWSGVKLKVLVPLIRQVTNYLNPHWGVSAPSLIPKLITWTINLTHHECQNAVCKAVSFTYGSGRPALWSHENLNDASHEWLKEEFSNVPLTFFTQMAACVRNGSLVSVEGHPELPKDFAAQPPKTNARFAFFTGVNNLCFLPESQIRSHAFLNSHRPGFHTLHRIPNYGHLDIFMGKNAVRDVYPQLLAALNQTA